MFNKQCNRVLEVPIKKEPYGNRIPDTRFYVISCIVNNLIVIGIIELKENKVYDISTL